MSLGSISKESSEAMKSKIELKEFKFGFSEELPLDDLVFFGNQISF